MLGRTFVSCLLILAISCAYCVVADEECQTSSKGYNCAKELASFYTLHWTVMKGQVSFALESSGTGWVGLGFPEIPGRMAPADVVIGWADGSGAGNVKGYSITMNSIDATHENPDIKLAEAVAMEEGESTVVAFSVPISGGALDLSLEGDTDVNFAMGFSDGLTYHRTSRGSAKVQLGKGM